MLRYALLLSAAAASRCGPPPTIRRAQDCLRRTTPSLELRYPADAEAHYEQLQRALKEWWGPRGPQAYWGTVERRWIQRFAPKRGACLRETFGPYIPILIEWSDFFYERKRLGYPKGLVDGLRRGLRKSVPYVTLAQMARGVTAKCLLALQQMPNVLVLSAGGYGHVPIPLFNERDRPLGPPVPMERRRHLVSYVGSMDNGPDGFRRKVRDVVKSSGVTNTGWGKVPHWMGVMRHSRASLVPRGFGRTAFHLVETLQLGLVPLYVYSDTPWVPYERVYPGYVASLESLGEVLRQLNATPASVLEAREERARALRTSHFTVDGFFGHLANFLVGRATDLVCREAPPTVRDAAGRLPRKSSSCVE